ncbi:alpha/beta hydrolase [Acutalibacter sp. 1XD8-33]|uniref:alpha/beta hydrolase n=1 Tax=Acutalibacter sp. 1XD8-33 TaxID=2320081 RepID=UPI000EA2747D|nr:alpha/beta hydrolase [Acutalibacter sp. 1XD8-33]RKJ39947.1 alpha/beta hydrolase [Acutalibacter sp. 1XD8-33]
MSVSVHEWFRPANSGWGQIFSRSWTSSGPVNAVLMIAHGMAEHSGRYDHFARFLAENGFAVYMNDHAGHGRSAQIKGHFADKDGWECVVRDLHSLMDQAKKEFPGLPLFLMGHSMGSFLARSYLIRYGEELSGCVLCGTMGKNPGVAPGKALAVFQAKMMGPRSTGKKLNTLATASYNSRIENPVNASAWLSRDEKVCRAFEADPLSNFPFTAAGYRDLFTGLSEISSPQWAQKAPKGLPVFLIAGDQDPVGNYGAGPQEVAGWLRDAGIQDVQLKLYPGMRHEVLNEIGKEEAYQDVLGWLKERLA